MYIYSETHDETLPPITRSRDNKQSEYNDFIFVFHSLYIYIYVCICDRVVFERVKDLSVFSHCSTFNTLSTYITQKKCVYLIKSPLNLSGPQKVWPPKGIHTQTHSKCGIALDINELYMDLENFDIYTKVIQQLLTDLRFP